MHLVIRLSSGKAELVPIYTYPVPPEPSTAPAAGTGPAVPELPARLTDPRPVLAIGSLLWLAATMIVWLGGEHWHGARPICLMGLAVGVLGYSIFWIQRRGSRRGHKGAQTGL